MLLSSKERFFENYLFCEKHQIDSFLTKRVNPDRLVKEIAIIQERILCDVFPLTKPDKKMYNRFFDSPTLFSIKELCILHFVSKGYTNKEMADIIGVSSKTVESHRRRIIGRTESHNIITPLLIAIKRNYISIGNF